MKTANDTRLWVDRYQGRESFGIFPDQAFYSAEITERLTKADADVVRSLMAIQTLYHDWCRDVFVAVQHGADVPPVPAELKSLVTKPKAPAKKKEAADAERTSEQDSAGG